MLNKSSKFINFTILILASMVVTGCFENEKKVNPSNSDGGNLGGDTYEIPISGGNYGGGSGNGSGNGGGSDSGADGGFGDGNEDGDADAGQTQNFFTINNIIVHSKDHNSNSSRDFLWSSDINQSQSSQSRFITDARFNVRVRTRPAPPRGADSQGVQCEFQEYESWFRYTKLDVDVCLRKSTQTTCTQRHTFEGVPVDQVSRVKEFSVPSSSQPLVIEVLDVRWDTGCRYDRGQSERYCPTYRVWQNDCVKFDIQFSTDYTKDFPSSAPRY